MNHDDMRHHRTPGVPPGAPRSPAYPPGAHTGSPAPGAPVPAPGPPPQAQGPRGRGPVPPAPAPTGEPPTDGARPQHPPVAGQAEGRHRRDPGTGRAAPPRMIWTKDNPGYQGLSVWTERVPGRGEDAEPFVAHHMETAQGLLAVFDGSGGSGAAPVWQAPNGETRTGAWVGARVARLATDCWFREVATGSEPSGPESLHTYVEYFLSKSPQRRSKISGTMRRLLPTTLAAVHYRIVRDSLELQPLWAGDSRAYVLSPASGLQVLTRDHTRESDALALLRSDPPMTNLVCADRDFIIDSQLLASFPLPCVLVVATDGWFGYVQTPSDFERILLQTLEEAHDERDWADLLRRKVQGYTADDASLAIVAIGHSGFGALRGRFAARMAELRERYDRGRRPGESGSPESAARARAWHEDIWHAYRAGYESCLPPAPEERA